MKDSPFPDCDGIEARNPAASPVGRAILTRIGDRNRIFLFPSQASANSWEAAMLRFSGVEALEIDRFMSWDSFLAKSRRSSVPKEKIQADPSYRLLWASAFLEGQAESPRLRKIVRPGLTPPSSLASSLARIAPSLPSLIEAATAMPDPPPGWTGENLADARRLSDDYVAFLDRHGLYEASWLTPELEESYSFLAFWPGLYPGFAELKGRLLDSGRFECFGGASEGFSPGDCSIRRYPSAREELSSVFSACRAFLDEGLRPEDIVLSLPNLDPATKAYLGSFSRSRGLPLAYRSGEPLSSSPFGSLLSSIQACLGEGFSLRTLRSLLEPRPFIWKREDELAALLRFGEKFRIPEAAFVPRETLALWKESLKSCIGEIESLSSLFSELASAAETLRSARSFAALRAALHDFRRNFLDERKLPKTASETMERVFVALDSFDACETRLGDEMPGRGRFDLLLSILDSTPYAPVSREPAIAVYPYQVGALVAAPLHFVLDLSQESTQSAKLHFTGLPRELADQNGKGDWSEAELLSALGASGAVYCHAEEGIVGYSVPHPFLLSLAGEASAPRLEAQPPSAEELEAAAWMAGNPDLLPRRLPSWAKKGAVRGCKAALLARGAAEASARKAGKIGGPKDRSLDPRILLALPACDARPDFKFSPARLTTIGLCPFRWFVSCVPGVEAPFKDPVPSAEGSLTHDLIGALLGEIAARDGKVDETKTAEYLSLFDKLFPARLEAVLRKNGPALRIALELVQPKLRARMAALLAAEVQFEQGGWDIGEFEVALSTSWAPYGIRLEGRADRIARARIDAGEPLLALVDYKKNKTPTKKDFLVDDEGKLADCQLTAYASMLDSQGKRMGAALYWSVETCKTLTVFGPGGERPDWDSFAPERGALEAALSEASAVLSEGRFLEARPASKICRDCGFRPICRAHFSSERL